MIYEWKYLHIYSNDGHGDPFQRRLLPHYFKHESFFHRHCACSIVFIIFIIIIISYFSSSTHTAIIISKKKEDFSYYTK